MKEKAIEIVKNLTRTINKIGAKVHNVHNLTREDMFAIPTASKSKLEKKRSKITENKKISIKENDISKYNNQKKINKSETLILSQIIE